MRISIVVAFLVAVSVLPASGEEDKKTAFLTPSEAGKDFEIQGEYSGMVGRDGDGVKVGIQVWAEGDGLLHPNGLDVEDGRLIIAGWGEGLHEDLTTDAPGHLLAADLEIFGRALRLCGPVLVGRYVDEAQAVFFLAIFHRKILFE